MRWAWTRRVCQTLSSQPKRDERDLLITQQKNKAIKTYLKH